MSQKTPLTPPAMPQPSPHSTQEGTENGEAIADGAPHPADSSVNASATNDYVPVNGVDVGAQTVSQKAISKGSGTTTGSGTSSGSARPLDVANLAGTSADELMDAVFEDVDYMLDKGVSIVPVSPQESTQPSRALAPNMVDSGDVTELGLSSELEPEIVDDVLGVAPPSETDSDRSDSTHEWKHTVKLAVPILGACTAFGIALATGLVIHSESSPNPSGASANPPSPPQGEFAAYVEKALQAIATDEENRSSLSASANGSGSAPPAFPSTPGTSPVPLPPSGMPERVYIPVYQPPQPSLAALPNVPIQGNLATPPAASSAIAPTPVPPQPAAAPTAPAPARPAPPVESTPPPSTLSYNHVLVGLLQLGDRSAAMFDYEEGTHRVRIGEQIGTSGWSLVSVSENEAIIRRNGEVRSVYIGQSF